MLYDWDMVSSVLLREARLRAGLTQSGLGGRVGVAASAIGRWERGEVTPSVETLRSLIRATGHELTLGIAPADDHDLALIRRSLAQEPAERLSSLVGVVRTIRRMTAKRV
ncbi:MAG: XRE family transcriptional regulator [Gemmatimonadetes bacterium]|nr:XRE family transcriptional regulator [Gemmatimonadota bacterium]